QYLGSSSLSGGTIKCEDQEFNIHKLVLCTQSNYFSTAFNGEWKESANGVIDLKGDDVSVVEAMLEFIYTHDYNAIGEGVSSPMLFNINVYGLADKYDVPELKSRAKQKFENTVEICWDMDDFPYAITQVYQSTPLSDRGLRELVVDTACKHIQSLLCKQEFCNVLSDTAGFASDMVHLLVKNQKKPQPQIRKEYRCPSCGHQWQGPVPSGLTCDCPHCSRSRSDWNSHVV
ncbi:hypothetical protein DM02DRAFT_546495, partial [Periconia macrospinosa]